MGKIKHWNLAVLKPVVSYVNQNKKTKNLVMDEREASVLWNITNISILLSPPVIFTLPS